MRGFLIVVVLSVAVPAVAQVTPYTATSRFEFEAPGNIVQTAAEALTFEPRFADRGVPLAAVTGMACAPAVAPRTGVTCSVPMGAANAATLNSAGVHQVTVAFFRADVGVGAFSGPFTRGPIPADAPTGLRVPPSP